MLSIALEIEWSAGTRASTETKPGELWYMDYQNPSTYTLSTWLGLVG